MSKKITLQRILEYIRNKYIFNTTWLFVEKVFRVLYVILIGAMLARYLGPDSFGLYSYVISFVGLFIALSTLGLDEIVVREIVQNDKNVEELLGTAFVLRFIAAGIVYLMMFIIMLVYTNEIETIKLIYLYASIILLQSFQVIDLFFQAMVKGKSTSISKIISTIVVSVLILLLIKLDADLIYFIYALLFEALVVSALFIYFYSASNSVLKWRFKYVRAVELLRICWPLLLSSVIISIYMKIDQLMIKEMLNTRELGYYAAAVKLSEAWYVIPMVICSSLFPAIIISKEKNQKEYHRRLQHLYRFLVLLAILLAILVTVYADNIINMIYGNLFFRSTEVLVVHIWSAIFVFMGVVTTKYLVVEGLIRNQMYRTILGAVVNVCLNIIFIEKYGIVGAAYATLLAQFSANFLYDCFDRRLRVSLKIKINSLLPVNLFSVDE